MKNSWKRCYFLKQWNKTILTDLLAILSFIHLRGRGLLGDEKQMLKIHETIDAELRPIYGTAWNCKKNQVQVSLVPAVNGYLPPALYSTIKIGELEYKVFGTFSNRNLQEIN